MVVVVIRNGEHLCGVLDKASLGSGSKSNIFYLLMRDHGEQVLWVVMVVSVSMTSLLGSSRLHVKISTSQYILLE